MRANKGLLFDRNSYIKNIFVYKLFVLDRNTWNLITVHTIIIR